MALTAAAKKGEKVKCVFYKHINWVYEAYLMIAVSWVASKGPVLEEGWAHLWCKRDSSRCTILLQLKGISPLTVICITQVCCG